MAYTPELSLESSRTLRRIAWALGVPMTQAIERVFEYMPKLLDPEQGLRCVQGQVQVLRMFVFNQPQ